MDGLKRRRPDLSLDMDVEAKLSEQAHPLPAPLEAAYQKRDLRYVSRRQVEAIRVD